MEISDLGKQPIPGDKPAGADIRYEPEFDKLQGEIDKLSIATQDGTGCDWDQVVQLGQLILAEKSKNIQVAAYLAVGLMKTREVEGLRDGVVILADLVEHFWDNMYPPKKRLRGRLNAVSWWMDQAEAFLSTFEPDPLPQETVTELKEGTSRLDNFLGEKSDDAPILSKLLGYINRLPVQVQEAPVAEEAPPAETAAPAGEESATAAPAAQPAPAAPAPVAAPPSAPSDINTSQDAEQVIENALFQLGQVSTFLMNQDLSDPMAYRLTRIAAWLTVTQLPMAEKGQTMIPAPDGTYLSAINNLVAGRDYENAIYSAEALVTQFLFWLDPSRISARALEDLGGKYQDAAELIATETALYVARLPGIENMSFSDGTPFADKETRAWLKSIALQSGGSGPAVSAGGGGEGAKTAEAFAKAQELLKDKKLNEAFGVLETGLATGGSGQARFLWRIALAQLLSLAARPDLARPHLDEIIRQVDQYQLEAWDPDLAIAGLKVVYEGLGDSQDEASQDLAGQILARVAGISPSIALGMSKV